jgi:hypothetical protein
MGATHRACGALGNNRTIALKSLRFGSRTVENRDLVTSAEQTPHHRRSHYSCSDPTDLHGKHSCEGKEANSQVKCVHYGFTTLFLPALRAASGPRIDVRAFEAVIRCREPSLTLSQSSFCDFKARTIETGGRQICSQRFPGGRQRRKALDLLRNDPSGSRTRVPDERERKNMIYTGGRRLSRKHNRNEKPSWTRTCVYTGCH